jgi:hypothetical protein
MSLYEQADFYLYGNLHLQEFREQLDRRDVYSCWMVRNRYGKGTCCCVGCNAAVRGRYREDGAGGGDRTRTGVSPHGILSPGRLPIPPPRHGGRF